MLTRHPTLKSLLVTSLRIFVGFFTLIGCFVLLLMMIGSMASNVSESDKPDIIKTEFGQESSSNKLLSIPVTGIILGDDTEVGGLGLLGAAGITFGYDVKELLYAAADDSSIKGVVLEINSPGGTIYGSQAIADGVAYYRQETGKPVMAFVGSLAASGGYWAAAATDTIVADHGTTIGSIGVIMGPFKHYQGVVSEDGGLFGGGVVTQKGIETFYVTAGAHKDMGNPFRAMTEEELNNIQQSVNNEYRNFVSHVAKHRGISESEVTDKIQAFIYDPNQAKQLKLIDEIGSREAAYHELAAKAEIPGSDFQVIRHERPLSFFEEVLTSKFVSDTPTVTTNINRCALSKFILAYHGQVTELCNL